MNQVAVAASTKTDQQKAVIGGDKMKNTPTTTAKVVSPKNGVNSQTNVHSALVKSSMPSQYNEETSNFFNMFNEATGRDQLFFGYIGGSLTGIKTPAKEKQIVADFGCGSGWLTRRFAQLGYKNVVGIDNSVNMRKLALSETPSETIKGGIIRYVATPPEDIVGKCDIVTAVHVHHHFDPLDDLRDNFFGAIASMLKPGGKALIIGCPSDFVGNTPEHYQNCVHFTDIPKDVLAKASDLETIQDDEGYVGLSCLKKYDLEDGTKMKVSFFAEDKKGLPKTATVFDHFWSDKALSDTAKAAGLDLKAYDIIPWDGQHPNAYMMMTFKKPKPRKHTL